MQPTQISHTLLYSPPSGCCHPPACTLTPAAQLVHAHFLLRLKGGNAPWLDEGQPYPHPLHPQEQPAIHSSTSYSWSLLSQDCLRGEATHPERDDEVAHAIRIVAVLQLQEPLGAHGHKLQCGQGIEEEEAGCSCAGGGREARGRRGWPTPGGSTQLGHCRLSIWLPGTHRIVTLCLLGLKGTPL